MDCSDRTKEPLKAVLRDLRRAKIRVPQRPEIDINHDPKTVQAKITGFFSKLLGLQNTESLVGAANTLLAEGHSEPAIVELSILESPIMAEAAPVFEQACAQLGVTIPSKNEAIDELLRLHLESIASGSRSPYDDLSAIMREVYFPHFSSEPGKRYVGDSRGMEHLIGAYWVYDDLRARPEVSFKGKAEADAISLFDEHVRELARDWLEEHTRVA